MSRLRLVRLSCDEIADGCPVVALASSASRRSSDVREKFEAGINAHLDILDRCLSSAEAEQNRDKSMAALSMMVGALLLSRVVNTDALSRRFLETATKELLASTQ